MPLQPLAHVRACPKQGGQLQIKMAKRVAERELTQENWDQEDEEEEVVKSFKLTNCYIYFSSIRI